MIYADEAVRQIDALCEHFTKLNRPEAIRNLRAALATAEAFIVSRPTRGLPAPRPYPALACPGRLWTKAGRYWVLYKTADPPIILAVLFDTANIPGRL